MGPGYLQIAFVAQIVFISAFFLHAVIRSGRTRRVQNSRAGRASTPKIPDRSMPLSRAPASTLQASSDGAVDGRGDGADDVSARVAATEELREEQLRLTAALEQLRAEQAKEGEALRLQRRDIALQIREHRRRKDALLLALPGLEHRVQSLRVEEEHLERRRDALRSEVDASIRTSGELRQRAAYVRREIADLDRDRERLRRCLVEKSDALRDLVRRRAVIQAESDELTALLSMLQQLADQPRTLTSLSDADRRPDLRRRLYDGVMAPPDRLTPRLPSKDLAATPGAGSSQQSDLA